MGLKTAPVDRELSYGVTFISEANGKGNLVNGVLDIVKLRTLLTKPNLTRKYLQCAKH